MGTISPELLGIAEKIWTQFLKTNNRSQVAYVPSVLNLTDTFEKSDCSNRRVSVSGDIRHTELNASTTSCESICLSEEQDGSAILMLVHRQPRAGTEFTIVQMYIIKKFLCIQSLKYDGSSREEDAQEADNDDFSEAKVEIRQIVPGSDSPLCISALTAESSNGSARSKNRKFSSLGK
ncbi:hypothetical protein AYI69_g3517 [Smittium culicis]|uniref:Uncharacterized protein n=1 Tax=Smittium culicis TaxID=133412 RepID=A0A1R1YJK7_9FUNG|nr:hypothetical protein AYI69_g3517 [Smittium culicis]